jgi:uncharacterized protein (TIGR03083 family)
MQLSPRYGAEPIIELDGTADGIGVPFVRQRRRLAAILAALDEGSWAAPSRCEGWRVQDVVAHLADADGFWALSLQAGLAGGPTRFLDGFDPDGTPAALVGAASDTPADQVRDRFLAATDALVAAIEGLDAGGWSATVEAPPGHIPASVMAHHALWDGWVHERDILLPLGLPVAVEDDEVTACLRYAAALGPAFVICTDPGLTGTLVVDATEPDTTVVVDVDDVVRAHGGPAPAGALPVTGPAVALVEAFSVRGPFPSSDTPTDSWLLRGLADAFTPAPTPEPSA